MAHGHGRGGSDQPAPAGTDRKWLVAALVLIAVFMVGEVVVGIVARSLALIADAGHMLTDVGSILLALIAIQLAKRPARGGYTYGLKRAEILSAQANGITLLLLAAYFVYDAVRRLIEPPDVNGLPILITALVGAAVNLAATWCISNANRTSLNVEGAFQHILTDLYAFIATAIAGAVIWLSGFGRADAMAALVIAGLMLKAGWGLVRASGRIFLEAAPEHLEPDQIGAQIAATDSVVEVHDLHIWQITSGEPALSAHVLVRRDVDCHAVRDEIEQLLRGDHELEHTTLQVDHVSADPSDDHCTRSHGPSHRALPASEQR